MTPGALRVMAAKIGLLFQSTFQRTQTSKTIGLIGDSRFGSGMTKYLPTVVTITGNKVAITATGIGTNEALGSSFVLGRSTGIDMIEATIESSPGANQIVAVVAYPQGALPQGSVVSAGSVLLMQTSRPIVGTTYTTWLLGTTNQGIKDVINFSYHGCRIQAAITHQARRAKQRGCEEVWLHISANDYLSSVDNKSSAYVIEKIEELWAACKGMRIKHFSETPLSSTYYSAGNAQKVIEINTWGAANAWRYSVDWIDVYSVFLDTNTGQALANVLVDGLHPAMYGSRLFVQSPQAAPLAGKIQGKYRANLSDAATTLMPLANPAMAGTLGANNIPTGYTSSTTGAVTRVSHSLNAKDSETQEYVVNLTSTGAGSHFLKGAATAVSAGTSYDIKGKIAITSGVNVNYFEFTLRNAADDSLIANIWTPLNYGTTGGDADGTYVVTCDCRVVIPAGVTSVYVRPRVFMGTAAGSVTVGYSDVEIRVASRDVPVTQAAAGTSTPADPTGTTSTTGVMMGLGASVTPLKGSRLHVTISGQMANGTINDGASVQLRFGTGTGPANAAALTGTQAGATQVATSLVAAERSGFSIPVVLTGLAPGVAVWLDAALAAVTGGTATITGVTVTAFELP